MEQGKSNYDYSETPREELVVVRELLCNMFRNYPDCVVTEHLPDIIKETLLLKTTEGRYVISKMSAENTPATFTIRLYDLEDMCRLGLSEGGIDIQLLKYNIYSDKRAVYICHSRGKLPLIDKYMSELNSEGIELIIELLTEDFEDVGTCDELRYLLLLQQKADELESSHGNLRSKGRQL